MRHCDRCGTTIGSDTPKEYYDWNRLRQSAPKVYAAIDEFFAEGVKRDKEVNTNLAEAQKYINELEHRVETMHRAAVQLSILVCKALPMYDVGDRHNANILLSWLEHVMEDSPRYDESKWYAKRPLKKYLPEVWPLPRHTDNTIEEAK